MLPGESGNIMYGWLKYTFAIAEVEGATKDLLKNQKSLPK